MNRGTGRSPSATAAAGRGVMDDRIKILPALMVSGALLLALKGLDIWAGAGELGGVGAAVAAEDTDGRETGGTPAAEAEAPEEPKPRDPFDLDADWAAGVSATEVRVLESLRDRRDALDRREQDLDMREKLLRATENRVDGKIAELKSIETRIEELMQMLDEEEEAQIQSLVKVYENMKAKDAARIFERLDRDILLKVTSRMREQKTASILAEMNADAAQALTVMLATSTDLPPDLATAADEAGD